MTHTTTHMPATAPALAAVRHFLSSLGQALVNGADGHSRMRQVQALLALSDAELAHRGLRRSDVARYVFVDNYWN